MTKKTNARGFERKYKILKHKAHFDKGWAFTSYIKYIIALFGLSSLDVKNTILIGLIYGVFCYFLGYAMYLYGWVEAEAEINNRYNRFVKEMRDKLKNKTFK